LELDRGTVPVDELGTKLARYARVYRYAPKPAPGARATSAWRERYPVFPGILCVLARRPGRASERRRETLIALCREDPELTRTPQVKVSVCLLEELLAEGPYALIFRRPAEPERP